MCEQKLASLLLKQVLEMFFYILATKNMVFAMQFNPLRTVLFSRHHKKTIRNNYKPSFYEATIVAASGP